ncbi:polysaccharide biosynthesis protein [Lujinxingia sediminis]|uniref:Polysaccharide biosynthesis protein n=1 Tax=Lujinxingia sediminis TaxID=2480984 RepID=A0ABY0CVK9_9DELT|nr:nucleoside-diphosphate sugar epimerase/dehydratase [Lujinxingia sediminis]RVU45911.1 polysaccharide biosynthesis protein [Lujinxingia sediminis]
MTSSSLSSWLGHLPRLPRWARLGIIASLHLGFFALAYFLAFLIRFDYAIPPHYQAAMWAGLVPLLATKAVVFGALRMFQGWWKYVSLYDVLALARALALASLAYLALNVLVLTPQEFPRSIYLLDVALSLILLGGARGSLRLLREKLATWGDDRPAVPVLIAGAGDTGETLVREIAKNRQIVYQPVGFIDDDAYKHGLRMHGVPVLGPIDQLAQIVEKHGVEELIIAMPSASRDQIRRVVEQAQRAGVKTRIVPAFEAVVEGKVSVNALRDVAITDLLGRAPVELDTYAIGRSLEGKRVLVTGAGGSIGSEICRQVVRFNPDRLILLDCAETPLFFIHRELSEQHDDKLVAAIGNVTDAERMRQVFEQHRPDVVLHAAAYKHVPLMEAHPALAVQNNIGGTEIVANLAAEFEVARFVLISTDKAVNPTSVMGATKRVAELLVRHLNHTCATTRFSVVRFGNVLGSNGSVIPIFRKQIARGGPVTVTHPEMTRYFMTIPEATQLVLQAATFKQGDLFILDMGEPVKIVDLARDMIRLSGFSETEIPIDFCGVRPGEKLFEELTLDREEVDTTAHAKIFMGKEPADLLMEMEDAFDALMNAGQVGDDQGVRAGLEALIPTYRPSVPASKVIRIESGRHRALSKV